MSYQFERCTNKPVLFFLAVITFLVMSCKKEESEILKTQKQEMKVSETGKQFIREREGLRLKAYWDGITYAIGYGNTRYEDGSRVKAGDVISQQRANSLFEVIVNEFGTNVERYITTTLKQSQFDALVSYAYNRGIGRFSGTTLLQMVNQNPNNQAIRQQFVIEWGSNTQFKNGLIKRRELEAEMYFSNATIQNTISNFSLNYSYLIAGLIAVIIFLQLRKNKTK